MEWWQYPVTNPYGLAGGEIDLGGHSGIDLGTPNNTPLYFPVAGKVIVADYQPWGGEVAVDNGNVIFYFLHMNDIKVKVGDTIRAGQVVGTSGGGVGDLVLKNGSPVRVSTQQQYLPYSTGYHTHFGLVAGSTPSAYTTALGQNRFRIDPTTFLQTWRSLGNKAAAALFGLDTTGITGAIGLPPPGGTQGQFSSMMSQSGVLDLFPLLQEFAQALDASFAQLTANITGIQQGMVKVGQTSTMEIELLMVVLVASLALFSGVVVLAWKKEGV